MKFLNKIELCIYGFIFGVVLFKTLLIYGFVK